MPASQSPKARQFPEPIRGSVVDYVTKHCRLDNLGTPFLLLQPPKSGVFADLESFVEGQLGATVEQFREEMDHAVAVSGTRPPHEKMLHLRVKNPKKRLKWKLLDADSPGSTPSLVVSPADAFEKFPADNQRAMYSKFSLLVQVLDKSGGDRVRNVGFAFCETMSKKDGLTLRAHLDVLDHIQTALQTATTLFLRKLRNFNFMSVAPMFALQELLASGPAALGELARKIFLGGPGSAVGVSESAVEDWLQREACNSLVQQCNGMQRRALALHGCVQAGPVLVQGPPGTGKSFLIANGILPWSVQQNERVLVLCNSNCALDSILEKVLDIGDQQPAAFIKPRVRRLGYRQKVSQRVRQANIFREALPEAMDELQAGEVRVLFTTLYNASGQTDAAFCEAFDTLVVDEAAQIEDSKIFIVLARLRSLKKVVFVGDHKQLQPYVSEGVRRQGFGLSTMERLMVSAERAPPPGTVSHVMLEVQHRMPAAVRQFVSQLFYGGRLQDGPNVAGRGLRLKGRPATEPVPPILVFDLQYGDMDFNVFQRSMENLTEAQATSEVHGFALAHFLKEGDAPLEHRDVCVLSPFNRHKNRLRTDIAGIPEEDWAKWENADDTLDDSANLSAQAVMCRNIDTVDKFQGSERDVVIINPVVVGNPDRAGDPHFINVACSRSKHLLVIVGHVSSIARKDVNWRTIYEHAEAVGLVFECKEPGQVRSSLSSLLSGPALKRRRLE